MADLVLIHGNAVGIKFFVRDRCIEHGNFKVFQKLLESQTAVLHGWHYINEDFGLWRTLNLWEFRHQYFTEKQYCNSPICFEQLAEFLNLHQPRKIVCHSMGCYLLLNSINFQGLPNCVSKVYLAQGDFECNFKITHTETLEKLESQTLQIFNYYCFWDQMLMLSVIANSKLPAGLVGAKEAYFTNKFFPFLSSLNFHHGTIHSPRFLQEVLE